MSPLRALVVEDDGFSCSIIAAALAGAGIEVVGECRSGTEAVAAAVETRPDVLVTDLDLGRGPNGVAVAHVLRRANPGLGVVLLTNHADPRSAGVSPEDLPAGTDYVSKQSVNDIDMLLLAIERSCAAAPERRAPRPATSAPELATLTDAQMETLRMLAEGLSNAEIARRRGVSERGVERMVTRLNVVLGVDDLVGHNRRMALARAFEALARGQVGNGLGAVN